MTLQQLEYAVSLLHNKSYSRAAKTQGISQPAISIQIKKLEEELDLKLFDRRQKKVLPTEEGSVFLDRAQLLLTQVKELKELAHQLSTELTGELRIGIIPTLAPYLLPLFIRQLNEQYSNLKIRVQEALTEEIIQAIREGELDGGIISTPIESRTNFSISPLFYEAFMLFVSPDHPLYHKDKINVKDIAAQDIWLLKEGNCFRDQVDNICDIARASGEQELFYFESNSIESLCRIIEFKGGLTFLPELTTLHLSADREEMIKSLKGPKRVREISLVHLPGQLRTSKLTQVADVIRSNIPRHMLKRGRAEAIKTNIVL